MRGDDVDEGTAHDDAIGDFADGLDVGGAGDAKADADGQGSVLADFGHGRGKVGGELGAFAGDAFAGDVVDETGGVLRDESDACRRRGRCHDEDVRQAMLLTGRNQVAGFFWWAIEHEQPIAARSLDLSAVGFDAEREE